MKKYLMCVLLVVVSGCVEVSDVEKMQPAMNQKNNAHFQYEIIDRGRANQYSVRFQMPESEYLLKKTLLPLENNSSQEFKINGPEWIDPNETVSGHIYQYEIGHYEPVNDNASSRTSSRANLKSEKWVIDYRQIVEIPFDLVLDDEHPVFIADTHEKVSLLGKINRLVMNENTHLYTMGNNLVMNIQLLQSKGGSIETFPENSTAGYMKNGLSGGDLFLNILSATEDSLLTITMRGQNGGQGKSGISTNEFCRAGLDGEKGMFGGDSGNLKLSVPEKIHLEVNHKPGNGGTGGKGGLGGPCTVDGPTGPWPCPAQSGRLGAVGDVGNVGKICHIYNNKEYCR